MGEILTGDYLTFKAPLGGKGKIGMIGKSTQKTRSGKNKLDLRYLATSTNFIENVDIETGSFELVDCWSTTIMYAEHIVKLLKPDTQYKMIADVTLLEKPETLNSYNNHNRLLVLYNANAITTTVVILAVSNTTEKNNWQVNATKHIETNFTTPADLSNYNIRAYNYNITEGETDKASGKFKYENVMILEATEEDETFEQYGVSPSPEFSSQIRNVGDNINRFDKSTIKTSYYLDNTGAEIANINYAITDYMKVEENENYVYQGLNIESSFASKGAYYNSNKEFVNYFDLNAENTLMKIPENVKYVRFTLRLPNNNQDTFKFEKGTIATPYSPYKCGNIETDICNNNLTNTDIIASLENSAITINSKNSFSVDLSKGYITPLQDKDLFLGKNDKNKRYKLSYHLNQNNNSFRPYLVFRYSDGTSTIPPNNGSQTEMDVTLTSSEGKTIEQIGFGWGTQSAGGIATLSDIYLRQVDDNSEFQEQEKQEFVFPLAEGQRLYEGSYLANDGIHHNRKQRKMVLSEFNISVLYEDEGICSLMNKSGFSWDYININGMCSHFKNAKNTNIVDNFSAKTYLNDNEFNFRNASNGKDRLYFKNSAFTTLEQWQDFFNNNDVIVEYECEEYVEAYTDEQQTIRNLMQNVALYEGTNNIFCTNEITPTLEVETSKLVDDFDFYISSNGYLVFPQYDKKYLTNMSENVILNMPEAVQTTVKIAGKDGDLVLDSSYNSQDFQVVMFTDEGLTPEQKEKERIFINRIFNAMKKNSKTFAFEQSQKFYKVLYSGILEETNYPQHMMFTIPLKSSKPYAYKMSSSYLLGNDTKTSETIEPVGFICTINGPALNPIISFNDYSMEFDNTISEGSKLIIDTNNSTAVLVNSEGIETNAMRYYNHQFPKIMEGENVLKVLSGIDNPNNVFISWYDLTL